MRVRIALRYFTASKQNHEKVCRPFLLITGILVIAVIAFLSFGVYSEGTRAGQVIKVSKKGVFFKTWKAS